MQRLRLGAQVKPYPCTLTLTRGVVSFWVVYVHLGYDVSGYPIVRRTPGYAGPLKRRLF